MKIIGFMFSLLLWTAGVETAQAVLKSNEQQHVVRAGEVKKRSTMLFRETSADFPLDGTRFTWDLSRGIGILVPYVK